MDEKCKIRVHRRISVNNTGEHIGYFFQESLLDPYGPGT
jgi:hypothetical protein